RAGDERHRLGRVELGLGLLPPAAEVEGERRSHRVTVAPVDAPRRRRPCDSQRVVQALRRNLAESWAALAAVLGRRDLRLLNLALAGSCVGPWSYVVAVSVLPH